MNARLVLLVMPLLGLLGPITGYCEEWFGYPIPTLEDRDLSIVRTGDLNGDGLTDMITPRGNLYLAFVASPDGRMHLRSSFAAEGGLLSFFTLIDGDADGDLDVVAIALGGGYADLWANDGTGVFTNSGMSWWVVETLGAGDVDGDGRDDLLMEEAPGCCAGVCFNGESGLENPDECGLPVIFMEDGDQYQRIYGIGVADFEGDGLRDLFVVGTLSGLSGGGAIVRWRPYLGNRQFGNLRTYKAPVAADSFDHPSTGDVDGVGGDELAVRRSSTNAVQILTYESGTGTLTPLPSQFPSRAPFLLDLNGDAVLDLALSRAYVGPNHDKTRIYRGLGDGTFAFVQDLHGATGIGFGTVINSVRLDAISVSAGYETDPNIAVWPNIFCQGAGVDDGESTRDSFRVYPSIATSWVEISLPEAGLLVEIIDIQGRCLRSVVASDRHMRLDLTDQRGQRLPTGIYWVRLVNGAAHRLLLLR